MSPSIMTILCHPSMFCKWFLTNEKALHNAVERKLCSEGWTRLSRWFILLPDPKNKKSEATNASISLNFFLNGTTICCAIEPGVPPSLARLRPSMTNPELLPMEVITAPWGLRGYFRCVSPDGDRRTNNNGLNF